MTSPEKNDISLNDSSSLTAEAITSIETKNGNVEFSIVLGDLTEVDADAIVCPANSGFEYAGFGGVQVAIARRAGMSTFEEAESKAKLYVASNPGEVSISGNFVGVPLAFATSTNSGKLERIKKIIHVNNMRNDDALPPCDEEVVRLCVSSVLSVVDKEGLESVSFPAMGTGEWGMSIADSLVGTIRGINDYFNQVNQSSKIKRVSFVIYAESEFANAKSVRDILKRLIQDCSQFSTKLFLDKVY